MESEAKFIHVIEHPLPFKNWNETLDNQKDTSIAAMYVQISITILVAIYSCFKFITYFFSSFHNKSQSPKAMYFWILGTFLNCFLTIYSSCLSILRQSYLESTYRVFLSILDMWPFMVVILLALDVLNETEALSNFEIRLITKMVQMNFIYSICLPFFNVFYLAQLKDLSRLAFINISYIPLSIFMVFVSYVFIRIFICERSTTALFFGAGALRTFQIGTFLLILSLFGKIILLYLNYIPPYYLLDYLFYDYATGSQKSAKYAFEFMFNIIIYIVPYLLIAAGAGYTKKKEEFVKDDNGSETNVTSDKNVLDDSLLNQ